MVAIAALPNSEPGSAHLLHLDNPSGDFSDTPAPPKPSSTPVQALTPRTPTPTRPTRFPFPAWLVHSSSAPRRPAKRGTPQGPSTHSGRHFQRQYPLGGSRDHPHTGNVSSEKRHSIWRGKTQAGGILVGDNHPVERAEDHGTGRQPRRPPSGDGQSAITSPPTGGKQRYSALAGPLCSSQLSCPPRDNNCTHEHNGTVGGTPEPNGAAGCAHERNGAEELAIPAGIGSTRSHTRSDLPKCRLYPCPPRPYTRRPCYFKPWTT